MGKACQHETGSTLIIQLHPSARRKGKSQLQEGTSSVYTEAPGKGMVIAARMAGREQESLPMSCNPPPNAPSRMRSNRVLCKLASTSTSAGRRGEEIRRWSLRSFVAALRNAANVRARGKYVPSINHSAISPPAQPQQRTLSEGATQPPQNTPHRTPHLVERILALRDRRRSARQGAATAHWFKELQSRTSARVSSSVAAGIEPYGIGAMPSWRPLKQKKADDQSLSQCGCAVRHMD